VFKGLTSQDVWEMVARMKKDGTLFTIDDRRREKASKRAKAVQEGGVEKKPRDFRTLEELKEDHDLELEVFNEFRQEGRTGFHHGEFVARLVEKGAKRLVGKGNSKNVVEKDKLFAWHWNAARWVTPGPGLPREWRARQVFGYRVEVHGKRKRRWYFLYDDPDNVRNS